MIASFLLLSHLSISQPANVTLRQNGAPLSSVLDQIEKQTGHEYSWDKAVARDPVIVKLTNRPELEVLDAIADVVCGKWVEKDGHPHLHRDEEDWAEHKIEEAALRLTALDNAKKATAKSLKTFDWTGEEGAKSVRGILNEMLSQYRGLPASQLPGFGAPTRNTGSAASQLLQRLLRDMPARLFDEIAAEESVVFSDHPNRLQKPIETATSEPVATFNTQQAAMIAAVQKELSQAAPDIRIFGGLFSATAPKGGVKKLLLRVSRPTATPAYQVRLWVVDSQNLVCGEAHADIAAAVSVPPDSPLNPTQADALVVRPSAEELCMNLAKCDSNLINSALFAGSSSIGTGLTSFSVLAATNPSYLMLAKQAQELALRPDLHEPMGQLPSDYVLGLADAVNSDVIALLPDEALVSSGHFAQTGRVTPGRVSEWLKSLGCEVRLDGGLIKVEPMRPVEVFSNRSDRDLLSRFLAPFGRKRMPRIADMRAYIQSGRITGILDRAYVRLFSESIEATVFSSKMARASVLIIAPYVQDPIAPGEMTIDLASHRRTIDSLLMSAEMADDLERRAQLLNQTPGRPKSPISALADASEKFAGGIPTRLEGKLLAEVYDEFAVYDDANGRIDYVSSRSLTARTQPETGMTEGRQDVTLPRFKYFSARLSNLGLDIPALGLSSGFFDIYIPENSSEMSALEALAIIKSRPEKDRE